jgi:ethanolamine utilization microcompartment shell protein EutL
MIIRLVEKGTTLTWGLGLSSDPRSEAIAAPVAVAALAVDAAVVAAAAEVVAVAPPATVACCCCCWCSWG